MTQKIWSFGERRKFQEEEKSWNSKQKKVGGGCKSFPNSGFSGFESSPPLWLGTKKKSLYVAPFKMELRFKICLRGGGRGGVELERFIFQGNLSATPGKKDNFSFCETACLGKNFKKERQTYEKKP